jgi:DNA-binding beta-propeller fold protein YncE
VWVANYGDGTLSRIDPRRNKSIGRPIRIGRTAAGVAVGAGAVWATDYEQGRLWRIDRTITEPLAEPAEEGDQADEPQAVVGTPIDIGHGAQAVAVGEGAVWVLNTLDSAVWRIDPSTNRPTGDPIPVDGDAVAPAVGAGAVWVASFNARTVTRIDP